MKKLILAIGILMLLNTVAEAARYRQRVTVRPLPVEHPYGGYVVDLALQYIFCSFHVFSIGPQGQPGSCAEKFGLVRPTPKYVYRRR